MIFDLAQDFRVALAAMPRQHPERRILELFEEAIRRDIHFIARHPTTLFQCMWNTCWWYDCPEVARHCAEPRGDWPTGEPPWAQPGPKLSELLEEWHKSGDPVSRGLAWIRSRRPPRVHLGSAQRAVLRGHEKPVNWVSFSPSGRKIISWSINDRAARIWDSGTGEELRSLVLDGRDRGASLSQDAGQLALWEDDTVHVLDTESGTEVRRLGHHGDMVRSVAFSGDGERIVTESWTGGVYAWSKTSATESPRFRVLGWIIDVGVDGQRVLKGYHDRPMHVWDVEKGIEVCRLQGHSKPACKALFSPDGRHLVGWFDDGSGTSWDPKTGVQLHRLLGHEGHVRSAAFSPDGRLIASGSKDATVCIWDVEAGSLLRCLRGHESLIWSIAFSPDGSRIASGSWDSTIREWDAQSGIELRCLRGHEGYIHSVSYSPDGRLIVSGSEDGTVRVWGPGPCSELRAEALSLVYSPDGRRIAAASEHSTIRVLDADNGIELVCLRGHSGHVSSMSYSPDGRRIVSGSFDNTIRIWDAGTGCEIRCLRGHQWHVSSVSYLADSRRVISGSWDKTIRLWDSEDGAELRCLRGHAERVESVSYPLRGRWIAEGSWNGSVRLWDVESGVQLLTLTGHRLRVNAVSHSPDGSYIISGSWWDHATRVWDEFGKCVQIIQGTGDAAAIAAGADRFPWRALSRGEETVIETQAAGIAAAWFPTALEYISTHPHGRSWAASFRGLLHIFTIEAEA